MEQNREVSAQIDRTSTKRLVRDVKFTSKPDGWKKGDEIPTYYAQIVFTDLEDAAECGARYVVWTLQRFAREDKLKSGPENKIRVNSSGQVIPDPEARIKSMTPDQLKAEIERMMKLLEQKTATPTEGFAE